MVINDADLAGCDQLVLGHDLTPDRDGDDEAPAIDGQQHAGSTSSLSGSRPRQRRLGLNLTDGGTDR